MTTDRDDVPDPDAQVSRHLAFLLRHRPEAAGLVLDGAGWVRVDDLLDGLREAGRELSRADLARVVAAGGKRRFELRDDRIRALAGHSVPVREGPEPARPPQVLYHGTVARFLDSIETHGLLPQGRAFVHLSADVATARSVGARRGPPVVLVVAAEEAWRAGVVFRPTAGGPWLADHVPPRHLTRLT